MTKLKSSITPDDVANHVKNKTALALAARSNAIESYTPLAPRPTSNHNLAFSPSNMPCSISKLQWATDKDREEYFSEPQRLSAQKKNEEGGMKVSDVVVDELMNLMSVFRKKQGESKTTEEEIKELLEKSKIRLSCFEFCRCLVDAGMLMIIE